MIRTFFSLPFGLWGFCEFPSTTSNDTVFGKIRNGGDLLVWMGRLELVLGRERSEQKRFGVGRGKSGGDRNLGLWNWQSFAPHR